jgi:hypothetical protein
MSLAEDYSIPYYKESISTCGNCVFCFRLNLVVDSEKKADTRCFVLPGVESEEVKFTEAGIAVPGREGARSRLPKVSPHRPACRFHRTRIDP